MKTSGSGFFIITTLLMNKNDDHNYNYLLQVPGCCQWPLCHHRWQPHNRWVGGHRPGTTQLVFTLTSYHEVGRVLLDSRLSIIKNCIFCRFFEYVDKDLNDKKTWQQILGQNIYLCRIYLNLGSKNSNLDFADQVKTAMILLIFKRGDDL